MTSSTDTPATPGGNSFPAAKFIKEIGRGVNGARALPREDAQALFDAMLAGRVSDIELGAVLMAYRIKGEAPHELAGMLEAAHGHCTPLAPPPDKPVVVIPSYNGARKQPNLVPLLALLLARDGVPTLVHGTRQFHGRVTSMTLFEALGVPLCATTQAAQDQLRAAANPLAVLPIEVLSPALARLLEKRSIIGLRNSSHTIVKMLQPIGAHTPAEALRLYSYTHPEYRETLTDYFSHEPANVLLARGTEGEVVADARRSSRIDWLHDGHQRTMVDPVGGSIGEVPELPSGNDPAQTAAWIRKVMDGAVPVPAPIVTQVETIKDCLKQATRVAWASPV
ncbi:DNA-binding protein YbiB [Cupriavidus sp. RAF12]|uniref:DNA-binding protein YbiB n=1 Tax=Cupriavidus sp. RAF12 TaxID=3233050 RepID=UPI003F91F4EE